MNKQQITKMAKYSESLMTSSSKARLAPVKVSKYCPKARVEQFPDDFYAGENVLFCKLSFNSVDIFKADIIKDHIKSKTHLAKRSF